MNMKAMAWGVNNASNPAAMASSIGGLHDFFLHHSSLPILPFLHISQQLMRFADL
jgi:hypothetical protein